MVKKIGSADPNQGSLISQEGIQVKRRRTHWEVPSLVHRVVSTSQSGMGYASGLPNSVASIVRSILSRFYQWATGAEKRAQEAEQKTLVTRREMQLLVEEMWQQKEEIEGLKKAKKVGEREIIKLHGKVGDLEEKHEASKKRVEQCQDTMQKYEDLAKDVKAENGRLAKAFDDQKASDRQENQELREQCHAQEDRADAEKNRADKLDLKNLQKEAADLDKERKKKWFIREAALGGGAFTTMGSFAGGGAGIGSIVPGVGTAIGGAIGLVVGGGIAAISAIFANKALYKKLDGPIVGKMQVVNEQIKQKGG